MIMGAFHNENSSGVTIRVPDDKNHGYNAKFVIGNPDRHSAADGLWVTTTPLTLSPHGDIDIGSVWEDHRTGLTTTAELEQRDDPSPR